MSVSKKTADIKKYMREYYVKNREKILARNKEYFKGYYAKNREKLLAYHKDRQKRLRDELKELRSLVTRAIPDHDISQTEVH